MSRNRKKLLFAFYVTLISLLILAVASYAWMSISSSSVVSGLVLSLVTDNVLEVAPDVDGTPGEWSTILDLSNLSGEETTLRPVTFSAEQFAFYAAEYGIDGRIKNLTPLRLADLQSSEPPQGDPAAADTESSRGYLLIYDFWIRTESTNCDISLTPPAVREREELGAGTFFIGKPDWNQEEVRHEDTGKGGERAIRVGFFAHETVSDPQTVFAIYEPNVSDEKEVTPTIDGADAPYEGKYKLIRQQASSFAELDPVLASSVLYTPGAFYSEDLSLFPITAGEPRHVTMFVWLEGQDASCTNAISAGHIFANLQFSGVEDPDRPIHPE